jgi:hypothetical protein
MSNNETSIRQGLPAVSQITSTGQRGDSKDRPSARVELALPDLVAWARQWPPTSPPPVIG